MRANADAVQAVAREAKPKRLLLRPPQGDRPCIDYSGYPPRRDTAGTFAGHLSCVTRNKPTWRVTGFIITARVWADSAKTRHRKINDLASTARK
jgi:hypothetical protein